MIFVVRVMETLSLDSILRRARALCLDAGLDPDRPGQDGRPEWLRFIGEARSSLRQDLQTKDPLKLLESTYCVEQVREQEFARLAPSDETTDPLEKLERLYKEEMHEDFKRANPPANHAEDGEPILQDHLAPNFDAAPTRVAAREAPDPLETLRALEAATRDLTETSPDSAASALRDPDRHRALKEREDY
ncbi:hypothetical protein AMST5_03862 [freshwater sediment metagenome]|uniref:Uncharacterized protein n=1 Tax=freshwater sediment metagenome TaxID=556182 RepID=A0AA48M2N5_9ZZZZ